MTMHRPHCPMCLADDSNIHWLIPMRPLQDDVLPLCGGAKMTHAATLDGRLVRYDRCGRCGSIYLQPFNDGGQGNETDHYIQKMADENFWDGYHRRYDFFQPFIGRR